MNLAADTKVFLLPYNHQGSEYDIIRLPLSNNTQPSFLVRDGEIFELRQTGARNRWLHNDRSVSLPRTNGAVKSLMVETYDTGGVLQSPNVIVATKFDLCFVFIPIMAASDTFSKRYISYEDVLDTIGSQHLWMGHLSDAVIIGSISKICEIVVENRETFYKYSPAKTVTMLAKKVQNVELALGLHQTVLEDCIRLQLHDPSSVSSDVPEDIHNLAVRQHALDLVTCYVPLELRALVMAELGADFGPLETYSKELRLKKKAIDAAEKTMDEVAAATASAKKANAKKTGKNVAKKTTKVAVGKGALDSFFKRS